jgi:hypothetical protein
LIDRKCFVLNALKCFGILYLSVRKVMVLEGSMKGKHLVITCTLTMSSQEIPIHALINCRATGIAFRDQDFAYHRQIILHQLKEKTQVEVIDGRPIQSEVISNINLVDIKIQDHFEPLPMSITKSRYFPVIPGIPSL